MDSLDRPLSDCRRYGDRRQRERQDCLWQIQEERFMR